MKSKISVSDRLKAFVLLVVSGWRVSKVYGNPKRRFDKNGTCIDYLITSGDGSILDVGNCFGDKEHHWMISGLNPSVYPEHRHVKMWKPLSRYAKLSFMFCKP